MSIFRFGSNFDGVYDNEDRRIGTKKIFVKLLFLSVLKAIAGSNWVIGGSNKQRTNRNYNHLIASINQNKSNIQLAPCWSLQ